MNQNQVLLKLVEQKTIKSELSLLFQLLTCNRGISQRRLIHTHAHTQTPHSSHTQRNKDTLFVFSH